MIQDPSEETIAGKAGTRACLTLVGLKLRQSLPCEAVHWPHVTLSVTARMVERSSRGSIWGLEPVRNTCSRKKNACSSHVLIVFVKQQMPHVQTHAVQTWLNDRYVTTKKPADGRVDLSNIDWSDSLMDNTLQRRWQHFIYSARSWIPIGSIK